MTHRPVAAAGYRPLTSARGRKERLTGDPAGDSSRPLPLWPRSAGAEASRLSWCSTESPSLASSASRDLHKQDYTAFAPSCLAASGIRS